MVLHALASSPDLSSGRSPLELPEVIKRALVVAGSGNTMAGLKHPSPNGWPTFEVCKRRTFPSGRKHLE